MIAIGLPIIADDIHKAINDNYPGQFFPPFASPLKGALFVAADEGSFGVPYAFVAIGTTPPPNGDVSFGGETYFRITDPSLLLFDNSFIAAGQRVVAPNNWQSVTGASNPSGADDTDEALANATALLNMSGILGFGHVFYQITAGVPGKPSFICMIRAASRT